MTREEIRLELLKLSYTHGRNVAEAVSRAGEMEQYIYEVHGEVKPQVEASSMKTKRKVGNPDILS